MKIASPVVNRRARIEIIPLIDIVFFLLATFALVSMSSVTNHGVQVTRAVTGSLPEVQQIVTISVTAVGEIYLDKHKVSMSSLGAKLIPITANNPTVKVLITGDEDASFGTAIGVLDEVRKLGITTVSIRTKH